jgi:hypothetical protein
MAKVRCRRDAGEGGRDMLDFWMVLIVVAFFAASIAYVRGCERL